MIRLLLILLLISTPAFADGSWLGNKGVTTVQASDASTVCQNVNTLNVTAGSITCGNGTATVSTGGSASNITGLISAGTNVTLSGNGTSGTPYVINSTGGGGSQSPWTGNINGAGYQLYSTGNIGVGSASPGTALDVVGTVRATNFSGAGTGLTGTAASLTAGIASAVTGETFPASGLIVGTTDSQTLTNKTLTSPTLTTPVLGTPSSGNASNLSNLPITLTTTGSSGASTWTQGTNTLNIPQYSGGAGTNYWGSNTNGVYPNPSANVGIGTSVPAYALDTQGTIRATLGFISGTGSATITGVGSNIGIGSSNPGATLDVAGTARMTGFALSTSPSSGYVLTSNSVGIGTWQPATGGGSGTVSGSTSGAFAIYVGSTTVGGSSVLTGLVGNIGVGSANPGQILDVVGTARATQFIANGTGNSTIAANVGIGSANPGVALDVQGSLRVLNGGIVSGNGNPGVTNTATTTCGCKVYSYGICTQLGTCS